MFNLTPRALVLATLFVHQTLLAGKAMSSFTPRHGELSRRIDGETVVLADCRDSNGVVSSEMAYFRGAPGPTPQDVSIVNTKPGQAALWINGNTSGLFTDTGVTFTSTIGPKVADGEFAGTGENGYGSFRCWQKYVKSLYVYDSTDCSQVYYCNHNPAPTTLHAPASSSPSSASTDTGLSQGALIAIVVGVVGTLVVAAAGGAFVWFWRRARRRNQQPPAYDEEVRPARDRCCGLFSIHESRAVQQLPPAPVHSATPMAAAHFRSGSTTHARIPIPLTRDDLKNGPGTYEMDGQWYRIELADDSGKFEMDGQPKSEKSSNEQSEEGVTRPPSDPPVLYAKTVVLYQTVN